jgi:hypothetical protein
MKKLQNLFSLKAAINKESPQGLVNEDELCMTGNGGQAL